PSTPPKSKRPILLTTSRTTPRRKCKKEQNLDSLFDLTERRPSVKNKEDKEAPSDFKFTKTISQNYTFNFDMLITEVPVSSLPTPTENWTTSVDSICSALLSPVKPETPPSTPSEQTSITPSNILSLLPLSRRVEIKKAVPAYERFKDLTNKCTDTTLILPSKYKLLFEQFKTSDFFICNVHNRNEKPTFQKIKQNVQQITKRNFEISTLCKIKTVYSTAYGYRQEKVQKLTMSPTKIKYELVVYPCLIDFEISNDFIHSIGIDPKMIIERLKRFQSKLFDIVKRFHKMFISSIYQLKEVNDDKYIRWHPEFDLENVPDIELADLPEPPKEVEEKKLATTLDILRHAQTTQSERVKKALSKISQNLTSNIAEIQPLTELDSKPVKHIVGVKAELLKQIRLKEMQKIQLAALENPDEQKTLTITRRLPETIELIQQYFTTQRQIAIEIDLVCKQLKDCHRSGLTELESVELVRYLCECQENDGWLKILKMRNKEYVKINNQKSIKIIIENIQQRICD
ncbi:unnamed protein product, partial [Didymodactylos carnosus]